MGTFHVLGRNEDGFGRGVPDESQLDQSRETRRCNPMCGGKIASRRNFDCCDTNIRGGGLRSEVGAIFLWFPPQPRYCGWLGPLPDHLAGDGDSIQLVVLLYED